MIRWRLGKFSGQKLNARELEVRHLEKNADFADFFERNHLDGHAKAKFAWGLFHQDKLVCCASFRINAESELEVARLATDYDFSVPGGASRLLSKQLKLGQDIVSYSNNRLSSGNVYSKLGFEFLKENPAGYWYTDGNTVRVSRWHCTRINDPEILARYPEVPHTEKDQALEGLFSLKLFGDRRPLYKIEDYGHKKWLLRYNPAK